MAVVMGVGGMEDSVNHTAAGTGETMVPVGGRVIQAGKFPKEITNGITNVPWAWNRIQGHVEP